MGFLSRFFGRKEADDADKADDGALTANPATDGAISLQVLLGDSTPLAGDAIIAALRAYDPSMSRARGEFDPELNTEGNTFGLIGWGEHVIKVVGFDRMMPEDSVESCVAPAHYGEEAKQALRAHRGCLLLYYAGYAEKPQEQYAALAMAVGALVPLGAVGVLNESAHTSLPAVVLSDPADVRDNLPLLMLFCGFVKYNIEGVDGVWMRTYGAFLMGLPDLAMLRDGHHQGEETFNIFSNILEYVQRSGAEIGIGDTMESGADTFLRFRAPEDGEDFLESDGTMLVLESIGKDAINR